jgi:antitoxin component YwqK of YwqJK toxin-antitoxin module
MDKRYRTSIPKIAKEKKLAYWPNGQRKSSKYLVSSQVVGYRHWDENGYLENEISIKYGVRCGKEYTWSAGKLISMEPWHEGKRHGVCKQWAEDGRLPGTYRMVRGTGIDFWRCNITQTLSEVQYWKDGTLHGWEWWINEDQESVWRERHHYKGRPHGIWREWNDEGSLRRGYPQYYVCGQIVPKRKYMRLTITDSTLPRFSDSDNAPQRIFPLVIQKELRL